MMICIGLTESGSDVGVGGVPAPRPSWLPWFHSGSNAGERRATEANSVSWLLRLVSGVYVLLRTVGGRLGLLTKQLPLDGHSQSEGLARVLLATLALTCCSPTGIRQVHDPDKRFPVPWAS
jgi:hypothetical protein